MKVGILGSGMIVPEFLKACKEINELEPYALLSTSRSYDKALALAKENNIKEVYTDIDTLLNNKEIEVIYVALPNHLHFEYASKCLNAKKHVILEKPFTTNLSQAQQLFDLAKDNNVYIFEAITNQYYPNFYKVKEKLDELGDIKIIEINYSQYSSRYDAFKAGNTLPVFDPDKSGGALYDLNVYNIHFILGLFGKPSDVHYYPNIEKGIDTSGILVLEYPTFKCITIGAKDCKAPVCLNIQGDHGYVHSNDAANVFNSFVLGKNNGEEKYYALNSDVPRFVHELKAFVEALKHPEQFEQYNNQTLNVMDVLTTARNKAGIKFKGEN